jgi:hypothetical protein
MQKRKFAIMTAIGLIVILAATVGAQPPMPDSTRLDRHLTMMKDRLNLSDSQTVQIRTILENDQKLAAADRDKYRSDRKAMQKARDQRRQDTNKQIMMVLNKDQQKQYEKMQKEMRQGPPGNRRRGGARPGGSQSG